MLAQVVRRPGRSCLILVLASISLALLASPAVAQASSNVRIVRLSFVEGTVSLRQPDADQWAKAFINTPIQQGFELATDANSFAEAEFENGSTARLGENSVLDFTELSLGSAGNKTNRMSLRQGYATFTVQPERGDLYQVSTPQGTFTADGKSMFRIDFGQNDLRLEVFRGQIQADSPYGGGTVSSNDVLEIRPGDSNAYLISRGITLDAWDRWIEQRNNQATVARDMGGYRSASAYGVPYGSLYGWNELSYYGNWMNLPGLGNCWFPFVASGWMPYTLGWWAYYPGFGYTWISGLPWGWLPFHYGNWIFASGYGWGWIPGNFGYWSPAVVNWYQGPGWIGWYPYAGRFRSTTYMGCQAGQNCVAAVGLNTFQGGGFVSPGTIQRVDPARGRIITMPNITSTRFVRLPGPAVSRPSVLSNSQSVLPASGRFRQPSGIRQSGGALGMRRVAAGAAPTMVFPRLPSGFGIRNSQRIVFNPQTHRYENGSVLPAGLNPKHGATQLPNETIQKSGASALPTTPQQPESQVLKTPPRQGILSIPNPGHNIPLRRAPHANLVPDRAAASGEQSRQVRKNAVPVVTAPNMPNAREGRSKGSNTNLHNNSPRMQPDRQRSGGFGSGGMMERSPGRSMQMSGPKGGGMSGAMQTPRGGTRTPRGPRR